MKISLNSLVIAQNLITDSLSMSLCQKEAWRIIYLEVSVFSTLRNLITVLWFTFFLIDLSATFVVLVWYSINSLDS